MDYKETAKKIKLLKIQGAESIALQAVLSLKSCNSLSELKKAIKTLSKSRPTEPMLRNSLFYVESQINNNFSISLTKAIQYIKEYFKTYQKKINDYGGKKIAGKKIIFTHCHSNTVMKLLKNTFKSQNFIVHNTETRPFFQGRITAKELGNLGIKVVHYVDSAARLALKDADAMLIGSDAITSDGFVINKIGSEMMAEIAQKNSIPVYVCASAWKFDGKTIFGFQEPIEKRFAKEVWKRPPKNVEISNYVFEKISPGKITAIISELGVYTVDTFISKVIQTYPWIV